MKILRNEISLTATDLANHLSCGHLTSLDLHLARGEMPEPAWSNPHLHVLQERGLAHEQAYVESLRAQGLSIVSLADELADTAERATWAAMKNGVQVIVQAALSGGCWRGRADVLLRVDHPERTSRCGSWSYEAVDCKLASETKAETALQLCLYSQLLADLQGMEPQYFHVIRPGTGFVPETYRFASFGAYYRSVKRSLVDAIADEPATYPEPVEHCDICRWWKNCDTRRRRDDHLSFVAGASRLQRKELTVRGVPTLAALAVVPLPIPFNPSRGAVEGYTRIRQQARIQLEARDGGKLKFEFLQYEPGDGLCRLPAPSPGDIFLDFEGDPFVSEGGLEYLFGVATWDAGQKLVHQGKWAVDRTHERNVFEWFIDYTFEQLSRYPGLHIYHFGAYEPAAIKRLMLRYATREEETDRLLRGKIFVDLHAVIKEAIRASVEQYSLKEMERFCGYQRRIPLPEANQARHFIEHQLELGLSNALTDAACSTVESYNEDDCRATAALREWLEVRRSEMIANGKDVPRPEAKDMSASEEVAAHQERVTALFDALTRDLPPEPENRTEEQSARWLLAHALDWHRREEKVKWWEFFRMKDCSDEDLLDEKTALSGLTLVQRMPKSSPRERAPIDRYTFPSQECSIRVRDKVYTLDENQFGNIVTIDPAARTIDIKKLMRLDTLHPHALFAHAYYGTEEQTNSILRLADWIVANGMDAPGPYRAARDLLLRTPPRLSNGQSLVPTDGETALDVARRLGVALERSVLPIQGPPGSGKTYTGARMICELVRNGKKVGITAVGHKVIRKLLDEVVKAAGQTSTAGVRSAHRMEGDGAEEGPVQEVGSNEKALAGLKDGTINVLGGTSWLWSRAEFAGAVDVLFVDEAGQMSLANVLACAPAGSGLVLLGDPQQLEQPQKGSHPEGSDISALAHLLDGRRTIGETQGLFLAETRRLHPAICSFTSELFYEGRLAPYPGLERQALDVPPPFSGAGLWFVPVDHEGNQSYSLEEIDCIAGIVEHLLQSSPTWIDCECNRKRLTAENILIVAPYNDQVNRLKTRIPAAVVGTVDKFQGQEAPVVIFGMTTSSPRDAPRGMEFLYSLNRFNVATSRARCTCIVVGSAKLLSPECRTPRHMELANVLCRYVETSAVIRPSQAGTGAVG
ncbi:MAG: TM0106 family RecB-like putative nuclease [Acidobacteriaceae bacterium]|nr:TM0106 family RecB-like putative nuclease [Acidobacteriaceae bacterium]